MAPRFHAPPDLSNEYEAPGMGRFRTTTRSIRAVVPPAARSPGRAGQVDGARPPRRAAAASPSASSRGADRWYNSRARARGRSGGGAGSGGMQQGSLGGPGERPQRQVGGMTPGRVMVNTAAVVLGLRGAYIPTQVKGVLILFLI